MKFSLYQESRRGGRRSNQDRVGHARTHASICMVLADGMGGHVRGEVAAQFMVDTMLGRFTRLARPRLADIAEFLLETIYIAHDIINQYTQLHLLKDSPRTTCVACVVQDDQAWWAHVGDSRLYHFGGDGLIARTRDHSAVQRLVDRGLVAEADMLAHPDRNKLYNSVGGELPPSIELSHGVTLRSGDVLLLASDGAWAEFRPEEMFAALRGHALREAVGQMLTQAASRTGDHGDNLSIVALRCGEPTPDHPAGGEAGPDGFTAELLAPGQAPAALDIDDAIAEMQTAFINRNPKAES
ncbi:MAG: protein phosphatase 2C domain-containing protein [Gallionellaceae bacterium]|nr:protein phosphatase 2C domain-containing protein [Gallionellaceae bacterium]